MKKLRKFLLLDIPNDYQEQFFHETMQINISRARATGIIFIVLEVLMIIWALITADWRWSGTRKTTYILIYASMILVQSLFLLAWQRVRRTDNMRAASHLGLLLTGWMLAWAAAVSLLDQLAYPQITVYVGGIFATTIVAYWPPLTLGAIYLLVEVVFALLLPHFQPSPTLAMGHIVNTITLVAVAWVLARMLYANRLQDFERRRIIHSINQELQEANRQLQLLASTDGLTKVLNRGTVEARMEQLWQQCLVNGRQLAVLMVDLDAFKAYNDNYGHQAGDRALQQVAAVLTSSLRRQSDLVGRYGGEEFIVAMSQENEQEVRFVAERIRSGVEALRILHHLSPAGSVLTVSVGFFSAKVTEDKPLDLFIQQADQALYQAKAECGNLAREYSG